MAKRACLYGNLIVIDTKDDYDVYWGIGIK